MLFDGFQTMIFPLEITEKAFALGERLVRAWQAREESPRYGKVTRQFHARMRSLILWRQKEWPYEYQYWQKHWGLQGRADGES